MEDYFRKHVLGKVFIDIHSYQPPTVVQVVGWTKHATRETAKTRFVYVREVKFDTIREDLHGGSGHVDIESIIPESDMFIQTKPNKETFRLRFEKGKNDEPYLSKGRTCESDDECYILLHENEYELECSWCQY